MSDLPNNREAELLKNDYIQSINFKKKYITQWAWFKNAGLNATFCTI